MATMITRSTTREEHPKKGEEEEGAENQDCHRKKKMKGRLNRGAWTVEEDRNLAQVIQSCGPRRWKSIAAKAGINRCGKSCRLRWMNYLRPNIKRGNISDQEEDLILRLHKLLGNRWSLIAGRLPGRTDNEIKNYWNSHLSKKIKQEEKRVNTAPKTQSKRKEEQVVSKGSSSSSSFDDECEMNFNVDDFFDFSNENPLNLDWVNRFVGLD